MPKHEYTIAADSNGRDIEWTFDTPQAASRFWKELKQTRKLPDTGASAFAGQYYRDGDLRDSF